MSRYHRAKCTTRYAGALLTRQSAGISEKIAARHRRDAGSSVKQVREADLPTSADEVDIVPKPMRDGRESTR